MITDHYLNNSRAQRILFMLEEIGAEYETNVFKRVKGLAPASLKKIHPLGKSPVITDNGATIAESGAIIEYLAAKYGPQMMVTGEPDYPAVLNYRYWIHYAEGSLMPLLVMKLMFDQIKNAKVPFFIKPVAKGIVKQVMDRYLGPTLNSQLAFVEAHLSSHEYFGGDSMNAADVQMLFPLEGVAVQADYKNSYPNIVEYVTRLQARPSYQRALSAGEPYAFEVKSKS